MLPQRKCPLLQEWTDRHFVPGHGHTQPAAGAGMPGVVLVARPPTNTFLLLGLCSWGTDFLTSTCAADVQRVSSLPVGAATGSHPTRPRAAQGSPGPRTAVRS